jgi:magnesium chelatase family protein
MLVAACNPCPCGRQPPQCGCTEADRARYSRRLSGPLLDRIDIVCALGRPDVSDSVAPAEPSESVRERVIAARERQRARLEGTGARCNAGLSPAALRSRVRLSSCDRARLGHGAGALSGRGHDRVLRVAATIADLSGRPRVQSEHVDEAMGFRLGASARAAA